jgi:hypothetical protein
MKKNIIFGLLLLAFAGCTTNAQIEIGLIDETLLAMGDQGDLYLRVTKIELPGAEGYETIWEGGRWVDVPVQNGIFASITDSKVDVVPDRYRKIRITVDSLGYIPVGGDTTFLVSEPTQFVAEAFTDIIVSDGDELNFAVNIRSDIWLSLNPVGIISGHTPFEGANLKLQN